MSNSLSMPGRIGKDAETRYTKSGTAVTSFSLANNVGWGDRKTTLWFDCSIWGQQGEKLAEHLTKGKQVFVSGEFSEREYEGKVYKQLDVKAIDFVGGQASGGNGHSGDLPESDDVPF